MGCVVRDVLRRDRDLRQEYGSVTLALSQERDLTIDEYLARKTPTLQRILERSDLIQDELEEIRCLNDPS